VLPRTIFEQDHEIFRDAVRKFMDKEIAPHHEQWEKDGEVDRDLWRKAGAQGLLCTTMPEDFGGGGGDFRHAAIVLEELSRLNASGPGWAVHSDIVAPYILHYGSDAQKQRWLPRMATGEAVGAIAMTEPGTGSDLQGVKTRCVQDGNELVIDGQKTFITNGQHADFVVVVAKTDPEKGAHGTSLVIVEADREGFARGRNLDKIGLKAQDTSELFFDEVRVPPDNMLGEENKGFAYLMEELPQERLIIAVQAVAAAEAAYSWTAEYVKDRKAFGQRILDFQNTRFKLAEVKSEIAVGRAFVDRCIEAHVGGGLDIENAAIAKLWATEMQGRVVDTCLQLFGGYGYMSEYPIARAYADARVQRIYGGTSEVMKELIGRTI